MERAPTPDPSLTPGAVDPTTADPSAPIPPMPTPSIDDASAASTEASAPIATAAPDPTTASSSPAAEPAPMDANAAPTAAAPVTAAPTLAPRAKTKGVADIVFLVDVSGSMAPCIDALRRNIEVFVDSLSKGDANNAAPVKDWRGKVVG